MLLSEEATSSTYVPLGLYRSPPLCTTHPTANLSFINPPPIAGSHP